MSILNKRVSNDPVRQGHQGGVDTGNINPLYVEEYADAVEVRFLKQSFMRNYFTLKTVRGTDTVSNDRMGSTELQKVTRGKRPVDHAPTFDNVSVKVDTIVLARTNQFLLEDFQERYSVRQDIGMEHGREIGKFFDESFVVQGIKGAQITSKDPEGNLSGGWQDAINPGSHTLPAVIERTAPKDFHGGAITVLAQAGDESDPELMERAIRRVCQTIEENDVDIEDAILLVRPSVYYTLLDNDKLISKDFSADGGDFANGEVLKSNGVRIHKTNRFPKQSDIGVEHKLSNAGNGYAYNVTQVDVNCEALLLMPKAFLAGETIPLTSNVHYSDIELQWFIDSYIAYAVTPNRAEHIGAVFKADPTQA